LRQNTIFLHFLLTFLIITIISKSFSIDFLWPFLLLALSFSFKKFVSFWRKTQLWNWEF
jgi:hypothetical protein